MRVLCTLALTAAFIAGCASEPATDADAGGAGECPALFDGESLDGWTMVGDADARVEDGTIVGSAVMEEGNSFLRTDEVFSDFDLELTFSIDEGFNSGVQFRSAQAEDTLRFDHQAGNGDRYIRVTPPGTVYGYQAEIDPTDRGWTAQLYEESGRGWLQTFEQEPSRLLIQPGLWHHMRIRAEGDSLKTWLDGQHIASMRDTMASAGFVALQVHTVYNEADVGKSVRFRNIRLCEL